ncbi:MAG: response regulator transcription factor [Thermoanaerobaculia bacterium]|nr:response regulator transcription factor [Thermoanaerobaculia bacterium]
MTARKPRVLVVEDEEAIAQGLVLNLERKDYDVSLATDGAQALKMTAEEDFDLILLDVRLPEVDGFEVCRQLRERSDFTPILMLTARSQPDDIVYGLKVGADDYVIKPFDLAELLARIEVRLRRQSWKTSGEESSEGDHPTLPTRVEFGEFWVDFSTFQALTREGIVELSRKEIAVMRVFLSRANQVITRRELLTQVWELPNHPNTRVVDNVIVALRKSFEENSWRPKHIHSVRGVGYRFTP